MIISVKYMDESIKKFAFILFLYKIMFTVYCLQ